MHMLKVKLSEAGRFLSYCGRETGDEVDPETHHETLDPERTADNYALSLMDDDRYTGRIDSPHKASAYMRKAIDKAVKRHQEASGGRSPRKDAVGICTWCVTLPEGVPDEQAEQFFGWTLALFRKRYGKDNVPLGFVHMDETTPHMHIPVIPLLDDKFNAKKFHDKRDLSTIHQDFDKATAEDRPQYVAAGFHYQLDEDDEIGKLISKVTFESTADKNRFLTLMNKIRSEQKENEKTKADLQKQREEIEKLKADFDKDKVVTDKFFRDEDDRLARKEQELDQREKHYAQVEAENHELRTREPRNKVADAIEQLQGQLSGRTTISIERQGEQLKEVHQEDGFGVDD